MRAPNPLATASAPSRRRLRLGLAATLVAAAAAGACRTLYEEAEPESVGPGAKVFVDSLPVLVPKTELADLETQVFGEIEKTPLLPRPGLKEDALRKEYARRIARYLGFLGLKPNEKLTGATLARMLNGSLQYVLCDRIDDFVCLEAEPWVQPQAKMRRNETGLDFGAPVASTEPLRLETYFTEAWDQDYGAVDVKKTVGAQLAAHIRRFGASGVDMAIYGIDDIRGTMAAVYDQLTKKFEAKVPMRAVVDTEGLNERHSSPATGPVRFTYVPPKGKEPWSIGDYAGRSPVGFQYKNSAELVRMLNGGIKSDAEARARLEWPGRVGIMHNKFLVFTDGAQRSVWTGTANVAATCMGAERNANVSIFVQNTPIAQAFEDEFEEMYGYVKKGRKVAGTIAADGGPLLEVGRFHRDKRPNTHRYFTFAKGDEVHVHFAPTDDGEHRIVLPLLLSAQKGDEIRIAMFGASGVESTRALQYAVAKGAAVEIVLDRVTGARGWINTAADTPAKRAGMPDLRDNPYLAPSIAALIAQVEPAPEDDAAPGSGGGLGGGASAPAFALSGGGPAPLKPGLRVRMDVLCGLVHHKSATLTRHTPGGPVPVALVVGSQNWTKSGNDVNDENMVTFYNAKGFAAAQEFNKRFDDHLWPANEAGQIDEDGQVPPPPKPCLGGGGPENDDLPEDDDAKVSDKDDDDDAAS
jgi:phosphatidylserine/phosphatidylglycerophosphate/cardiolipin synthase-like enzyme